MGPQGVRFTQRSDGSIPRSSHDATCVSEGRRKVSNLVALTLPTLPEVVIIVIYRLSRTTPAEGCTENVDTNPSINHPDQSITQVLSTEASLAGPHQIFASANLPCWPAKRPTLP